MEPTKELIDELYRRRVFKARQTPPEQKLLDCLELFDYSCQIMRDGLRDQYPNADHHNINNLLRARLELRERLEQTS